MLDNDVFERAQEIVKERTAHHREVPLTTRGQSLLVGNVYCGHCGARLMLTTSGRKYQKKDGTIVTKTYSCYKCYNKTLSKKCDGQSTYGVEKLDTLMDQIIRIQFERIQNAPPHALIEQQHNREMELAKARLARLNEQYQQKQRDHQDLRSETLKVIKGISRLNVDLLNSLIDETTAQLKDLESQIQTAETQLREVMSSAEQVKQEYTQLMNWAELYDNCTFEAKKMIVSQVIKAIRIKRGYEVDIEFNVSFEEFQTLYLEPESEDKKIRGAGARLALAEKTRQAG